MINNFKSGFVSIIGKTNVGKSTLINKLVGEKVSITTHKPQTTRTAIKAIINTEKSQIIFVDTPGIHKAKTKLGETMVNTAFKFTKDVDVLLFMIDATNIKIGKAEEIIIEQLKDIKKPIILIINKVDLIKKEEIFEIIEEYSKQLEFAAIFPISAIKKVDTNSILSEIEKHLNIGPAYYNAEEYTDQTERQLVEEVVREKALKFLNEEIPHGIYVEVDDFKTKKIQHVDVTIYCARESHKGIIIGKNGEMLKRIGTSARIELEQMLQIKLNLKLWVKVSLDWQEKDNIVKKFMY